MLGTVSADPTWQMDSEELLEEPVLAELPPADCELLEPPLELEDPPEPGMRSVWPMRISAREFRSLASMIARTVVSWREAMPETVFPERTRSEERRVGKEGAALAVPRRAGGEQQERPAEQE